MFEPSVGFNEIWISVSLSFLLWYWLKLNQCHRRFWPQESQCGCCCIYFLWFPLCSNCKKHCMHVQEITINSWRNDIFLAFYWPNKSPICRPTGFCTHSPHISFFLMLMCPCSPPLRSLCLSRATAAFLTAAATFGCLRFCRKNQDRITEIFLWKLVMLSRKTVFQTFLLLIKCDGPLLLVFHWPGGQF